MTQQIVDETEETALTPYQKMDKLDEAQIVAEIEGGFSIKEYFYEFPDAMGKTMTGLSWEGTKWFRNVLSEMGRPVSITQVDWEEKPDRLICTAWAKLMVTGERSPGISDQPKMMRIKKRDEKGAIILEDGKPIWTEVPDVFARQKALSKAKRNAYHDFIPTQQIIQAYMHWKANQGKMPSLQDMKSAGHSEASSATRALPKKFLKDFKGLDGKRILLPVDSPYYVEFNDSLKLLKEKYPGLEETLRKEGSSVTSVLFVNMTEEAGKEIDELMASISEGISKEGKLPV